MKAGKLNVRDFKGFESQCDTIELKHLFLPVSVENGEHCDFTVLRNMLIR